MQLRKLGRTDIAITPVILGTWQAGKKYWVGIEDDVSVAAIRAAVEAGLTTIDTAEEYGEGHSEQIVARAVGDRRHELVYASKVFANHLKYKQVIEACERSLRNLNTDYIDLYQIHWPSGSWGTEVVPIAETMEALEALKTQGKIRAIGVSNFSVAQMEEASQYGRIDSLQPPYSLFWRTGESQWQSFCVDNDITILAYSSLAQGLLTGKFDRQSTLHPDDVRSKNKLFQGELFEKVQDALDRLRPIAEKYDTSLTHLALAWTIAQPNTCAIVGVRTAEQGRQNAAAMAVSLSEEDIAAIDAIGRTVTDGMDGDPVMWQF